MDDYIRKMFSSPSISSEHLLLEEYTPDQKTLEKEASHALEEIRIVLPGAQALFGFQLIAVFSQSFHEKLSSGQKLIHFAALGLVAIATILLMTPAAYHRQTKPQWVSEAFVRRTSRLITGALLCLAHALCLDVFLISTVLFNNPILNMIFTGIIWGFCIGFWFLFPRLSRKKRLTARKTIPSAP